MNDGEWIRMTDDVLVFWKRTWPSNMYTSPFTADGNTFSCAEHYFMWSKAKRFGDTEIADQILQSDDPAKMKRLGRRVANYDDDVWAKERMEVMMEANRLKYAQNPDLARRLLATGDRAIAEASPVDTIWGIGLSPKDPQALDQRNWTRGQNLLGQVLTQIRGELRSQGSD